MNKDQDLYENQYVNKEDLKSPSAIRRQSMAADLLRDNATKKTMTREIATNLLAKSYSDANKNLTFKEARNRIQAASLPKEEYNSLLDSLPDEKTKKIEWIL